MRTRGLRWAGVLVVWAALIPSAARAQSNPKGLLPGLPWDDGLPPTAARGQIDAAPGYALPDTLAPSPFGNTRPEAGAWFVHGEFLLYRETVPLRNQQVAQRGFVDVDGAITGMVGTRIGNGASALETNQVRGPLSYAPGFEIGAGYRFGDGTTVDFSWVHLISVKYTALATLLPRLDTLAPDLSNTFLFSPVFNFPLDFGGPPNDVPGVTSGSFGIWNGADLMTIEFDQRYEMYDLTIRKPIFETECWRTYGLAGPRFAWIWERFKWFTEDLDGNGDPAPPADTAIYTNIVSNRMYGVFVGIGNECYLGHGLSTSLDLEATGFLDIVKERVKYERGDRHIGPERKRSKTDYTVAPSLRSTFNLWWYPYEGIQIKLGYDVMSFFNTVASKHPIDFDYSAVTPSFDRVVRFIDGLNIGIAFSF